MSRLKTMDNKNKLDWNAKSIKIVKENITQKEKNIRELENTIQSIVFARTNERRMNLKVWKCFNYIEILAKHTITFHTVHWFAKKSEPCVKMSFANLSIKNIKIFCIKKIKCICI